MKGLAGKFLGGSGGTQKPFLDIALSLLTNPQTGGLEGLVETFKSKRLSDIMSSLISTGQLPDKDTFEKGLKMLETDSI